MSSKLKVLQVIPKLGYGGAETGCIDIAHYLFENNYINSVCLDTNTYPNMKILISNFLLLYSFQNFL